jgi:hypothetical protein
MEERKKVLKIVVPDRLNYLLARLELQSSNLVVMVEAPKFLAP